MTERYSEDEDNHDMTAGLLWDDSDITVRWLIMNYFLNDSNCDMTDKLMLVMT